MAAFPGDPGPARRAVAGGAGARARTVGVSPFDDRSAQVADVWKETIMAMSQQRYRTRSQAATQPSAADDAREQARRALQTSMETRH